MDGDIELSNSVGTKDERGHILAINVRRKVGIDLSPVGFRSRAPGTAVHVENQARTLLALDVDWDWVLVATPKAMREAPYFESFDPIIASDRPLSFHVCFHLGRIWAKADCCLGLATAFFVPFTGPPVVANYFDANAQHAIRDHMDLKEKLKSETINRLFAFSRRRARALFIDSEFGRARMIEAEPGRAQKWVVAPCGVPPVPAAEETPTWATKLNGRPFVLYIGAFSNNKNQRRLIEAWDQLRRRREDAPALVLIGPAPAEFLREVIEPAVIETHQPNDIIMPGFIPELEVAWAYRHAHAYVQPSFAEGFGMPVVQAMSCGVPVACSNSTSLPEVAGGAATLFEPDDIISISTALERLVFDQNQRARQVSAGLERAKQFTWQKNAEIVARRIRAELDRTS